MKANLIPQTTYNTLTFFSGSIPNCGRKNSMLYFSVLAFFLNMNFFSEMVLCCDRLCKSPDECLLQQCNGECIPKWEPCNKSCSDASYWYFNGRCIEKAKIQLWECNGQLQCWSVPCNGTCRDEETFRKCNKNELLQLRVEYNEKKIIYL